MTQKNSLSEWLEQTRRINKHVDQICMDAIDGVIGVIPYIDRKLIRENKKFFDKFCISYHKPNPIDVAKRIRVKDMPKCTHCTNFVQGSLDRCWVALRMVNEQWYELIDFMWERPELVNPALLDEYVRTKIYQACRGNKKKNPLANGIWRRFGTSWRDKKGKWHSERRRRF